MNANAVIALVKFRLNALLRHGVRHSAKKSVKLDVGEKKLQDEGNCNKKILQSIASCFVF